MKDKHGVRDCGRLDVLPADAARSGGMPWQARNATKSARSMSSEPQVTSSKAPKNSTERVLTRRQADLLPVYAVVARWLHREPAFLREHEREHHLEELASDR